MHTIAADVEDTVGELTNQNKDYSWQWLDSILEAAIPPQIAGIIGPDGFRKDVDTNRPKRDTAKSAIIAKIDEHYIGKGEVEKAVARFAKDIQRKVDLEYQAGGRYPGHIIEPWADIVRPIINRKAAQLSTNNKDTLERSSDEH